MCVSHSSTLASRPSTGLGTRVHAGPSLTVTDPAAFHFPAVHGHRGEYDDERNRARAVTAATASTTFRSSNPDSIPSASSWRASSSTQDKVRLEVGSTITAGDQMQIGSLTETVTVVSEAVEATKADRGTVIDNLRVHGAAAQRAQPVHAVVSRRRASPTTGRRSISAPFDNGAIADWSINGGWAPQQRIPAGGAPNVLDPGRQRASLRAPPVDAVQEFKIVTNSYDAQYGRTAGGVGQRVAEVWRVRSARHGLQFRAGRWAGLAGVFPQGEQPAGRITSSISTARGGRW